MFNKKVLSVAVAVTLSTTSPMTYSLGVGNNSSAGILNRPLNIELPLIAESFELHDLKANLADDQQHERFGLVFPIWMPKLRFETVNSQQGPILKVTTYQPIKEPIVNFVLEIKYKDVVLFKEITLFLDPVEVVNSRITPTIALDSIPPEIVKSQTNSQTVKPSPVYINETSFRVESGQSLWKIAKNWSVDNVNLQQKMQAIFLSNQDAFINGDMNKLKQGSIISLSIDSLSLLKSQQKQTTTKELANKSNIENTSAPQTQIVNSATLQLPDNQLANNSQLEKDLSLIKDTISQQEILNLTLRAELERLEQQIKLKEQLILAQNRAAETLATLNNLAALTETQTILSETISEPVTDTAPNISVGPANVTQQNDQKIPISINTEKLTDSESSNNLKSNSPFNVWLTAIWFGLAIIIAYLGTIISGKRNAKKFAKKLDHKLQDLAYNKRKQLNHTPTIKELAIPQNLAPSVQIKYLNSAADFYIRCHRHDLAKELVNEGLLQFRGNAQIIDTLNQIRKRIFNHLDNDIHAHIVEKLDARVAQAKEEHKVKDDNIIDIDDFNAEWLKKWEKKVS